MPLRDARTAAHRIARWTAVCFAREPGRRYCSSAGKLAITVFLPSDEIGLAPR